MYRVLSISRNVRLLLSRNHVLALAGFSVMSPREPEQAAALAAQQAVDAVIIGHSIMGRQRKSIIHDVRRVCPQCLIGFVFVAPDVQGEPLADFSLDVTQGPEPLITALLERLPPKQARRSVSS